MAVPARDRVALVVDDRLDAVPGQHGVAALDVVEVADDWLAQLVVAARAEMASQVTDPQHQFVPSPLLNSTAFVDAGCK